MSSLEGADSSRAFCVEELDPGEECERGAGVGRACVVCGSTESGFGSSQFFDSSSGCCTFSAATGSEGADEDEDGDEADTSGVVGPASEVEGGG